MSAAHYLVNGDECHGATNYGHLGFDPTAFRSLHLCPCKPFSQNLNDMQKLVFLCLAITIASVSTPAQAQEGQQQGQQHLTVLSFIVPYPNLAKWNAMDDSVFIPVLNGLVDDGHFLSWGQLRHNWGDEWNVGTYIVSESHLKFVEGWAQYWQRLNECCPGWFEESAKLFTEHKDNMYMIPYSYDGAE